MPRKGKNGKQDWLDWSSDDEDDGAGPSSGGGRGGKAGKKKSSAPGWGGWEGNRPRVHGLDRLHARLHGDAVGDSSASGTPRRPAFALRDRPSSPPSASRDGSPGGHPSLASASRPAPPRARACPPQILEMFGDALPRETLEDIYVQCGRSVDAAVEALLALSMAEPRERAPSGGGVDGAVVGVNPAPAPSRASRPDPSAPDLWDALPVELRLLILDRLGSREAARAARVCRDFASTVRAWRRRARGLVFPPDLSVESLASMAAAYPNVTSISFRRCARRVSTASDIARVLRAASAGPAGGSIESVDLEGCDAVALDGAPGALLDAVKDAGGRPITELKLSKCAGVTDKSVAALAAHAGAEALTSLSLAGTSTTERGLATALGANGAFPRLDRLDASGCAGIKGSVALPPLLRLSSLRVMHLSALTSLHAQLPATARLRTLHASECRNLRTLAVSAATMETINASQCKRLDRLELHCARLRALVLQHCASLVAPTAFACPALSEELNVNGCASLTTSALERMSRAAPKLRRVRANGCASMEGELSIASRALEEVSAEGCARLTGIRIAAPLRILEAKACKSLASAWIEPPPERDEDDEEEDEAFDDDDDANELAGRVEGSNPGRLRVDLRNCSALVRLVGVRTAALEGRLEVDLEGCASLPASARPPKK